MKYKCLDETQFKLRISLGSSHVLRASHYSDVFEMYILPISFRNIIVDNVLVKTYNHYKYSVKLKHIICCRSGFTVFFITVLVSHFENFSRSKVPTNKICKVKQKKMY